MKKFSQIKLLLLLFSFLINSPHCVPHYYYYYYIMIKQSNLRKMLKYEEKASGIETNISDVELLLEQLVEYEDAAEALQKSKY